MLISSLMLHCWHCSKWKADSEIVHYGINQSLKMVCVPWCCDIHPARAVRGVHSPVNTHCPLSHDGVIPLWKEEVMKLCVSGFWLVTSHTPGLLLVTLTLPLIGHTHTPGLLLVTLTLPLIGHINTFGFWLVTLTWHCAGRAWRSSWPPLSTRWCPEPPRCLRTSVTEFSGGGQHPASHRHQSWQWTWLLRNI